MEKRTSIQQRIKQYKENNCEDKSIKQLVREVRKYLIIIICFYRAKTFRKLNIIFIPVKGRI